ncbi:MAG: hypothetical protein ACI977_000646 [Candidatus Nanohaloarchaea archaeon]|jgi:hypothetical protein
MTQQELFKNLEEGELILFNDRKTPLEVSGIREDGTLDVAGPSGGEYEIYRAEEDEDILLVSKKGNRRYSSYCKNLRRVGEWVRKNEDRWEHSKTGAEIELVKNDNGFWTIKSDKFEDEIDTPKYGYSSKEFAEEEAEKFVKKNPEG